jgi:hypothetical protein
LHTVIFRNILKSYKILRLRKLAAGLKTYEILCKITKYCEPQNYGILQIVKLRSFAYRNISKYFKKLQNITLTQTCGGSGSLRNIMMCKLAQLFALYNFLMRTVNSLYSHSRYSHILLYSHTS